MGTTRNPGSGEVASVRGLGSWVASSWARHRVPLKVNDPAALARVAVLLGGPDPGPIAIGSVLTIVPAAPVGGSEPPDRVDAVGVELAGAGGAGGDHDVIEDRGDDGGLAGQVEVRPRAV